MFCCRCGKTVRPEWSVCENCGTVVGNSKFDGLPYTSAQSQIEPGSSENPVPEYDPRLYTRTTYTGGDYEEQYDGEVDVRTSYRPVYDYDAVPDDVRDEMMEMVRQRQEAENAEGEELQAEADVPDKEDAPETEAPAEEPAQETPVIDINDIEGFDMSKIKARPIVARKPAGLSSEVEEYVRKLDISSDKPEKEEKPERPARRGKHLAANDPYRDEEEPKEEELPEEYDDQDDEYYEDDEYEPRRFNMGSILKVVIALVVVAVLFVGGVFIAPKLFDKFQREATAPIEGVTLSLYDAGIDLIDKHLGEEYINGVMTTYQNGGFVALTTRLNSDQAEVTALLPETPSVNDQLFIDAVSKIQDDIGSAITMDAIEKADTGAVTSQASQDRWADINETVAAFKTVNSAAGLSAIISGERIVAVIATPTPVAPLTTPAPQYPTLSKGDDSEDVKKMQQRLWDLGYLNDEADGKFGNNTQTALKLFQQEAGLEVTGVADNATQELLYSDDAPMTAEARITPKPEPTEEPVQPAEVTDTPVDEPVQPAEVTDTPIEDGQN